MQEFKINVLSLDMDFEVTVIGAGVIGLCIARKMCKKNFDTVVIEKNKSFGKEGSSRNSGVIHAGIYYKKSSKKSIFCKIGNKLLYEYIKEKKINHLKCGKLIVASCKSEDVLLKDIKKNASKNGVNLIYYNKKQTNKIEPQLNVYSSLFSPTTGTVDVHEFMFNLENDVINDKGLITYNSEVEEIWPEDKQISFKIKNENKIFKTRILINSAGLFSHKLAKKIRFLNFKTIPKINYIKGDYFKLIGRPPFKKLIYPLPSKNSLGIHSTINFNNETIFGPDEEFVDKISYNIKLQKKKKFIDSIKKYWPEIEKREIQPDYSGIRTTSISNDFIVQSKENHKINGLINLYGINSPGLTSSLALSEFTYANIANGRFVE